MKHFPKLILSISLIGLHSLTACAQIQFTDTGQEIGNDFNMFVELGDVDSDGDLDAVEGGNIVRIRLNDGTGYFALSQTITGNNPAFADFDKDGDLDLFITNYNLKVSNGNEIWLNDDESRFSDIGLDLGSGESMDVELSDLDGDGDLDDFVVYPDAV